MLGFGIQPFGRFVQDDDRRLAQQRPGNRDPTALSARQARTRLFQPGVEPFWPTPDGFTQTHDLQHLQQSSIFRGRGCHAQVVTQSRREQPRLLGDTGHQSTQFGFAVVAERTPTQGHRASARCLQPSEQCDQTRLAASAWTKQRNMLTRTQGEIQIVHNGHCRIMLKTHCLSAEIGMSGQHRSRSLDTRILRKAQRRALLGQAAQSLCRSHRSRKIDRSLHQTLQQLRAAQQQHSCHSQPVAMTAHAQPRGFIQ